LLARPAIASTLALVVPSAAADSPEGGAPFLDDCYSLSLGVFYPQVDSRIRLDSSAGVPDDETDFEDTLALEECKAVAFGGFRWRMSPRNLVESSLFNWTVPVSSRESPGR
jgi:hypothetical protein